jgi:hypothetical protein
MKKTILILAVVCGLVIMSGNAQAAWYKCTVNVAGVHTTVENVVYINAILVDGSAWSGSRWFVVTGPVAKSALATALTAVSNESYVYLVLDSGITQWSPIQGIFMISQ